MSSVLTRGSKLSHGLRVLILVVVILAVGAVKPHKAAAADCQAISQASPGVGAQVSLGLVYPDGTRKFSTDFKFSVADYNPHPTATTSAFDYGVLPSGAGTKHIKVGDNIPAFDYQGAENRAVTDYDNNHGSSATYLAQNNFLHNALEDCSAVPFIGPPGPGKSFLFDDFWYTGSSSLNCMHGSWGQSGIIPDHSLGFDFTLDTNSIGDVGTGYSVDLSQPHVTDYRYGPNGATLFEHFNFENLPVVFIVYLKAPVDVSPSGNVSPVCTGLEITNAEDPNKRDQAVHFDVYTQAGAGIGSGDADATTNNYTGVFSLVGKVSSGTVVKVGFYNYTWQGVNDNSKAHWVENITWNPAADPNCANFNISDNPSIVLKNAANTPDDEFFTQIDFTNRFTSIDPTVGGASPKNVKDINIACSYYIIKYPGNGSVPGVWTQAVQKNSSGKDPHADLLNTHDCNDPSVSVTSPNLNLAAGDQVCTHRSASPGIGRVDAAGNRLPSPSTADYAPADYCINIVNHPYVTFSGGDVVAGGSYGSSSCPIASGNITTGAGSSVEFAAFAMGAINGFATATSSGASTSSLAFANTPTLGNFGLTSNCVHDYYNELNSNGAPLSANTDITASNAIASSHGKFASATPRDVHIGPINGITSQKTLYVDGDAYIDGNITYSLAGWTVDTIPSFYLVVKGNIYISPAVGQIEGVFIAQPDASGKKGYIYTCYNAGATLPDTAVLAHRFDINSRFIGCNNQLTVNGAFQAQHVFLDRAKGSPRNSTPAEVFNLMPELYMANPALPVPATGNGKINSIQNLPPVL